MKVKTIVFTGIFVILFSVIAYSGYQLYLIQHNNADEAKNHDRLMEYRPALPSADENGAITEPKVNQKIVDLQAKYPDAVGWITVPNTKIDYPFAQAADNNFYLHRDLDKQYLFAGTVFMDHRNRRDFSDFNTVLFGHHMKNRSMFGDLQKFNDQAFFDANKTGTIFLADKTYTIEFFAFIVLKPSDAVIYDPTVSDPVDEAAFLAHAKDKARFYRDIGVTTSNRIVTLSTCNYEFNDARMVLLGRLVEM